MIVPRSFFSEDARGGMQYGWQSSKMSNFQRSGITAGWILTFSSFALASLMTFISSSFLLLAYDLEMVVVILASLLCIALMLLRL